MTIALVTMTKNGRQKLPRLFDSVKGFVDKAVILDTGSTDETVKFLESYGHFPVAIDKAEFVNFEVSRNRLMEVAKDAADWLLLLDDDMALRFEDRGKAETRKDLELVRPEAECFMLKHAGPVEYWVTRLVRGDRLWTYKGVTHEYLERSMASSKLSGIVVDHFFRHGPDKFVRDLQLLAADIARDPDDARTIFYLAQTLRDMGKTTAAIHFYCMRANMGGWPEEVYYSKYEASRLAGDPNGMTKAYEYRPSRAEAPHWLVQYWKTNGNLEAANRWEEIRKKIPMTQDILFVNVKAYG